MRQWCIDLLASKMYDTAKSIVMNLVFLVQEYGFVPNGAQVYYTNRTDVTYLSYRTCQTPLLSAMIYYEIYLRTCDVKLLEKSLLSVLKEYQFWNSGIHGLTIQNPQASNHKLSRYCAMWNKPRPESAIMDEELASKLKNESERQHFYRELASAAESGWDFSTRWMRRSTQYNNFGYHIHTTC